MGVIEGNAAVSDNDWETVKKGGDDAIKNWIAGQLKGRSCTVVLVGENTAGRKWITHEIVKSWDAEMGVVGIRIHNLKDSDSNQSKSGGNPFDSVTLGGTTKKLSSIVKLYDPSGASSAGVYKTINENLEDWIEEAIKIRAKY